MDAGFWDGRRVLVTGHTGFKGSWLTLWLRQLGATVTGLALPPDDDGLFVAADVARDCDSRLADVRDAAAVAAIVDAAAPEVVFHLAAQSLVRASYRDPVGTWATNVIGTVHVLDALRRSTTIRAIIVVTSDKCYEHAGGAVGAAARPFHEDDALGGHDPYSSSKAGAEIAAASWARSFFGPAGIGVATARAGNVIGGGDRAADRLIPDLVRSAVGGVSLPIRSPRATRPWQHVVDPLTGYLLLAERLVTDPTRFAGAWNFGPDAGGTMTVVEIAQRFATALDRGARWHVAEDASLHEAATLALDSAKARTLLGWRPDRPIDDALAMTAAACRVAIDGGDLRRLVLDQLAAATASSREPAVA